jgi:ribonuclease HI
MNKVTIHTDGSANNHTKMHGGYGIHIRNGEVKTYSGGQYINTNSSRMELMGCLMALKKCKTGDQVEIFIDNQYVVNSFALRWIFKWEKQQWKDRKNKDLLKQILIEYRRLNGKVEFKWVRGHDGKEENEICDLLAKLGGKSEKIIDDNVN